MTSLAALLVLGVAAATLSACAPDDPAPAFEAGSSASPTALPTGGAGEAPGGRDGLGGPGSSASPKPASKVLAAGNPNGTATVPAEARAVDTSKPTRTIGTGTPASCTSAAVVKAVAAGGVITFNCGPAPVTIKMAATAKVRNANGPKIVLDGGGTVTLSGQGQRRILYMNTCDQAQGFTTSHCQNQDHPQLTVQNLTFADGNSTGDTTEGGGGGAVLVRGGHLSVINTRFTGNRCDPTGPDLGGAALRVLSMGGGRPVSVVGSRFTGGVCSNGGALSSIGVSWDITDSVFTGNRAIGRGANPARGGTPGGGSGGAIYLDGNTFTLRLTGVTITGNSAAEGGGAIFFVSNDRTGTATVRGSTISANPSAGFETAGLPGWFFLGAHPPTIT
jgi:hypothetical protein